MGAKRLALDPVADLKRRLARLATPQGKAFWTGHLQGAGVFRGVPIAKLRGCVRGWWAEHGFAAHPAAVGKRIALALLTQRMTEDKLAGMVVLAELIGDQLRASDLPEFARLFDEGQLAEGRVVDWFAVKVLATLLEREPERAAAARALATWRGSGVMWQRRAACVGLVGLAARGDGAMSGLGDLALTICAHNVWSHERFDQTAVGWLLRELSRAEPARVVTFVRRHARLMTRESVRIATAKLPAAVRAELRAEFRRATTPRGRR
jgi:3-methyladenine DNA glycosylase AlkD